MAEDDLVPQGGVMPDYDGFVGIDWATQTPAVCLLDAPGRVIAVTSVAPSGPGLAQLLERLRQLAVPAERIAVAIETPRAALVEALLSGGCHVFAGNPKQLDRCRDRHRVAGAKDDRRDALVIAAALRTDGWAFRHRAAEAPQLIELREISRRHGELVPDHLRRASRWREHRLRFSPQALARCPAADPPWLWTGLARVPTPAAAARGRVGRLRAILADQRRRRCPAEERHRALTTAPLPGAPGPAAAAGAHVALRLPRRRLGHDQQGQGARRREPLLTRRATAAAAAHQPEPRDVPIRRAVPGGGRVVAATMLAEASGPRAVRDEQTLRAHAGVAPVTRQRGKTRNVAMRRSCHHRLRPAVLHWASTSLRLDSPCRMQDDRLRQRPRPARALRGGADRLLRILVARLTQGTIDDAARPRRFAA